MTDPAMAPVSSRPHWSARIENFVNRRVGSLLRLLGWQVRVQPFTGYGSTSWVRVHCRLMFANPKAPHDLHSRRMDDQLTPARRGWRNFTARHAPHQPAEIEIDGKKHRVRSDRSGLIDARLPAALAPGKHKAMIQVPGTKPVAAPVVILDDKPKLAMISDIDDTVMVTMLPRPLLAAWNAFVMHQNARKPVPGMPELYGRIAAKNPDIPVFYVSTGAWNAFPNLVRFLRRNRYPSGPILLTDWGPTNTGFFRSGRKHKEVTLELLAVEFPNVEWLLIGDDGQHDPEIYEQFASHHQAQTRAIVLRQLTPGEQVLAHGYPTPTLEPRRSHAHRGQTPLIKGADGHELAGPLHSQGIC